MLNWVSYKGRPLGAIVDDDRADGRFVFFANKLESLAQLFKIADSEEVHVEGSGNMRYSDFVSLYLKGEKAVGRFYPTREDWLQSAPEKVAREIALKA